MNSFGNNGPSFQLKIHTCNIAKSDYYQSTSSFGNSTYNPNMPPHDNSYDLLPS
jgi:hypothetical protein